ncbi:MAG: phenylacetate-CoA oxygenase subunit PaaI [Sphingobacteriales bacterium]|nr:MAG: phenylacetate-CoA oxygenase subunit PaaI [Sphingobacteriales bacterium]
MLRLFYVLQLADNALIHSQLLSAWCGHGPILEQDIAITNTALDHIGQARSLYQYASELLNALPESEKAAAFSSPLLQQVSRAVQEDDLSSLRDGWDFRNVVLVEQPNGDWAQTIAKSFFYDVFQYLLYQELLKSPDTQLSAIAEKSIKEVTYHKKWSSEWVIRLGDGTAESHDRMQKAVDTLWSYTGELFMPSEADAFAFQSGMAPDVAVLKDSWLAEVTAIFDQATLQLPSNNWMQKGGKQGMHTEHLGYVLTDLQFMQRAYPNMEW